MMRALLLRRAELPFGWNEVLGCGPRVEFTPGVICKERPSELPAGMVALFATIVPGGSVGAVSRERNTVALAPLVTN